MLNKKYKNVFDIEPVTVRTRRSKLKKKLK